MSICVPDARANSHPRGCVFACTVFPQIESDLPSGAICQSCRQFSDGQVANAAWISLKVLQCLGHTACSFTVAGKKQCMLVKASSHSRIKTIKVVCDRCKQIVEGIQGEEFTAGFYNMTKWEEYRRENEQYVCASCMFADPKYVERYGSCF
jgi:hypothetical protein